MRWRVAKLERNGEAQDGVVELARVRTARPRLQLLAMEGVAMLRWTTASGYRLQHDGGGRRLMGRMGWQMEDAGVSRLVER